MPGACPPSPSGLMDAAALDQKLGSLPEIMGGRPYAVNVVSLAENPCRQVQLDWIKQHRPRFVVIAGGNLSFAKELLECGLEVMYIAPDEALMRLALEAGVRYVICEGYEAGGHVGPHSTLTLAQMVLNLNGAPHLCAKTVAWFWPEASIIGRPPLSPRCSGRTPSRWAPPIWPPGRLWKPTP